MNSYTDDDMKSKRNWAQRTILNWRFWVVLPVTLILLPAALVSLVVPFGLPWYGRMVKWSQYRYPYNRW